MALDQNGGTASGAAASQPSNLNFETLLSLSGDAILQLGLTGTLEYASPSAARLFGWDSEKLPEHLSDLVYLGPPNPEAETLHKILSGAATPDVSLPHADLQLRSAHGSLVWAEVTTHLIEKGGEPAAFAVFFRSIARQKELEGLLEAATQTDTLTGLFNRRAFEDTLNREWAIALRENTHTTLIKVSVDKFDAISEQYGQSAADDCVTKVADVLKDTARRPADVAARISMSEFALLLPRTHEMGAETISAYIQVAIQDLGIPNPGNTAHNGVVTASVGTACAVAEHKGVLESSEFLLAASESCVFQARQEGGNRVNFSMSVLGG
ncbi:GGDEF domain-containing protein [Roseibium alexandrii]|uniref:GGDEF domain-containing protein n=1 Tax=Roseibium alexandrii TaxID=388408 RepID=UPI00375166ED